MLGLCLYIRSSRSHYNVLLKATNQGRVTDPMKRPRLIVHHRRSAWSEIHDGSGGEPTKPPAAHMRFTLRGLLLLTALAGVLMALVADHVNKSEQQRAAVTKLRQIGAKVKYSEPPSWPLVGFIQRNFGIDFVANATFVSFIYRPVASRELNLLTDLRQLQGLDLFRAQIDDNGLAQLASLNKLAFLDLRHTQITDAGLRHLRQLRQLDTLHLASCQINGPGLINLQPLSGLVTLDLAFTSIQDQHLAPISQLKTLVDLNLNNTALTGDALQHLQPLHELRRLNLYGVKIPPQKLRAFAQKHPECNINSAINLNTLRPPS